MPQAERDDLRKRLAALPPRPVQAGWAQVTSDAEASEDQLENARERVRGGCRAHRKHAREAQLARRRGLFDRRHQRLCDDAHAAEPDAELRVNEQKTPKTHEMALASSKTARRSKPCSPCARAARTSTPRPAFEASSSRTRCGVKCCFADPGSIWARFWISR